MRRHVANVINHVIAHGLLDDHADRCGRFPHLYKGKKKTFSMAAEDTPKVRQLRSYLNLRTRITASDNRVFNGIFMCIDKYKNIILSQTEEFRDGKDLSISKLFPTS